MDKFTRKTSFEQWFSPINRPLFDDLVKTHQLNHYTKKLYMASFMKLLLYAQLHETESLRALSDAVFLEELQRATGLESISFSQLGRRINAIPTVFFQSIFLDLVAQIHEKTHFQKRRKLTTPLKIIDSSTLPLDLTHHKWAEFRKTKSGVKLHLRLVFMEKGLSYPDQAVLTNANEHDRGQLEVFVDDKECMYVFDRGYLDYGRFDQMTEDGYFFVTRLRKNAVVRVLESFSLPEDSPVFSDEMVVIGTPQNRSENVFRLLKLQDTKGNELHLLTNRFDMDADEIAEIYQSRWAIELFFKWMKQHLNIKKFFSHSEQAVHNQVYVAMIVYGLNVLAQLNTNSERSYLQISRYFFLAYSPERVDPGNKHYNTKNTPKVVGGATPTCTLVASTMYRNVLEGDVHEVSSPKVAEMEKILENTFRNINIALANEMAILCHKMGIDVWEVIDAAATKPYGFMPFYPGPGLGGHCIPIDPWYLTWKAREYNYHTRLIEIAGEINDSMSDFVVQRCMEILNEHGKALKGSDILVLGVAYKKDIDDYRESPVLPILTKLTKAGANWTVVDPHVKEFKWNGKLVETKDLHEVNIEEADLVLITTNHSNFDYELIANKAKVIFDTRNIKMDRKFSGQYYKL